MIVTSHGDEDRDNLTQPNDKQEGVCAMDKNIIEKLMNEVEIYKQAIQDAKDALASAEMELDEALEQEFNGQ